ncbi:type II toxin-antitoxin system CcdA family antitoxin [Aestuariispira insulae]|uniref:Antitoxin CcdA n=1 Tax=Aestuariispira insulae TaxID=1461337 RepID=A0A3D9H7K1_9PROT|nr:type II toxin-antitoxin system CcdA family antitoxin [Aestuariispira insulae]RED45131.1 antitoxin CcdA [Aestuariispira insulae]
MSASTRKHTNLSMDPGLLSEAKALKINLSRAAEDGIRDAIAKERARLWREENAAAIESANQWVEENGLPLAKYRQF